MPMAPNTPDYKGAAEATAAGNRPNINTPFGSQSWSKDSSGNWTMNNTFTPEKQAQMDALGGAGSSMANQAKDAWGKPLDNGADARQHAEDAIYGRASSRLDPQWAQREQQQKAELLNSGLDPGSEAYNASMGNFDRGRNDAYATARQDSIIGGGQEASRQQQLDLTSRMAPLQGYGALQGLQHLPEMPGFHEGPDYLGAAGAQGNFDMQRYLANMQMVGSGLQAGGGLASKAFAF